MALFTDSDIVTQDALSRIDSEVTAVARAAKPAIIIEGPGSICEQAWIECGQRITSAMQMYTSYLVQPGMSGGHIAAVLNTGAPARTQARTRLQQIVANDSQYGNSQSTIQAWMAYSALALFFRSASSRLGNDRFEEKYKQYKADAEFQWGQLRNNGLPFIWVPMEAPGAKHGFKPGSWGAANVSGVAAAVTGGMNVAVAVTYCDAGRGYLSQASNGNAESAPSDVVNFPVPAAQALRVDISSLNPPAGAADQVGLSQGTWTPLNATHWNLWAGRGDGVLYLQRELIPIATKQATLATDPVFAGSVLGNGQWPDLNITFQNVVGRG